MDRTSSRGGYTLTELLVTSSLLASAFALVGTTGTPNTRGQIRRAAQSLAGVLTSTQSRGLGVETGAAVIIENDDAGPTLATSVSSADMLPHVAATARGIPPANPASLTASGTITPLNADVADLQNGYKICFYEKTTTQPPSAWMQFAPPASASSNVATVSLRGTSGQSPANTIWPKPVSPPFDVLIARYPAKSSLLLTCPKAAAIDLRYSGIGDDPATPYGSLAGKGAIAVAFDRIGGIDAVMQQVLGAAAARTYAPLDPVTPVYFLVAARETILDPAASTLASEDSLWVVIQPQTGRVQVSANVPQPGTSSIDIRNARAKARAAIAIGK